MMAAEHDPLPKLPRRPKDGHKGTFGTVCVVGGQAQPPRVMLGGPAFTAEAALRVGAGLAVLAVPAPLLIAALEVVPSATGLSLPVNDQGELRPSDVAELLDQYLYSFRCLAVGPGLGAEVPQQQIVVRLAAQSEVPMVLDADGLNALAALPEYSGDMRASCILTPHPGEYKRLAQSLGLDDEDPIDPAKRGRAASTLAQRLGCVVVLKGSNTVVSDGLREWTSEATNPALATAGTGDVLTGVIAGLVAQFFKPHLGGGSHAITAEDQGGLSLYDCARLGVAIHARAAEAWSAQHGDAGLIVRDLLALLPDALTAFPRQAD